MRQPKTRFNYHDSRLTGAGWRGANELWLTFSIVPHWNDGMSADPSLIFNGVCNRRAAEASLREIEAREPRGPWIADVLGFGRDSRTSYWVATSKGTLMIDAVSFREV